MIIGIKRFSRNSILYCYVYSRFLTTSNSISKVKHVAIERYILVKSPLTRAMVYHDISNWITTERVFAIPYMCITTTETHMANNYVMSINLETFTCDTYSITRSCLSGNSNIWSTYNNWSLQFNNTTYIEYDDTCATLFTSPSERTNSIIIKIAYGNNLTATTTKCVHTATFCTRK